jgi:hypothetical protein
MATKKRVSKKAVVKRAPTDVAAIQEQLAQEAAEIGSSVGSMSGNIIKIDQKSGTHFEVPGLGQADSPMDVVILDFISQNTYYAGKYNANKIVPPDCIAIGKTINQMKPSGNSPDKQAEECNGCPLNEWGSDGDGKACKNTRLLAVMPPDNADGDIMLLRVSPTGLKSFDQYVGGVSKKFGQPPIGVITEISIVASGQGFTVAFGNARPNEHLGDHFARRPEAQATLESEPDFSSAGNTKRIAKKKVVRRRR